MFGAFRTFGRMGAPAGRTIAQQIAAMSPSLWLEPSVTNGYQDSAGTTALTQPGGGAADPPVGLALDLSGNGRNASQSTSTARPKLSARVNLLTGTDNPASIYTPTGATESVVNGPDGSVNTAARYTQDSGTSVHKLGRGNTTSTTQTVVIFNATQRYIGFSDSDGLIPTGGVAVLDTQLGVIKGCDQTGDITYALTVLSAGVYQVSLTYKTPATVWRVVPYFVSDSYSGAVGVVSQISGALTTFAGDGVSAFSVWHPQDELGSTATAYQRVTDANTYAYAGWPLYWKFDGTDDALATGNIDLTGTDKVTVVAVADPAPDDGAYRGIVGNGNVNSTAGAFGLFNAITGLPAVSAHVKQANTQSTPTAVVSQRFVATASFDTSTGTGSSVSLRINGVGQGVSGNAGVGMMANAPIYISNGSALGGSGYRAGNIYALLIFPRLLTAAEIAIVERYVAQKAGVTL